MYKLENGIGSLTALLVCVPLMFVPYFLGTSYSISLFVTLLVIVFTTTYFFYPKYKIGIIALFFSSFFLFRELGICALCELFDVEHSATIVVHFFVSVFLLILYGIIFDFVKMFSLVRVYRKKNNEEAQKLAVQNDTKVQGIRSWTLVFIMLGFIGIVVSGMLVQVMHRSDFEKAEDYFAKNEKSFVLLKDEVLRVNSHLLEWEDENRLPTIETNKLIDSIANELNVSELSTKRCIANKVNLSLKMDLSSKGVAPFEYWNNDLGINQYATPNGENTTGIGVGSNWGIHTDSTSGDFYD